MTRRKPSSRARLILALCLFFAMAFLFTYFNNQGRQAVSTSEPLYSLLTASKTPTVLAPTPSPTMTPTGAFVEVFTPSATATTAPRVMQSIECPILMYHWISRPENFSAQMDYLFENGYYPISLQQLIAGIRGEIDIMQLTNMRKPFVVTFDDGWQSQFQILPILTEKGIVATFFIVADQVGGGAFMDATSLKSLADAGQAIGSHSLDHSNLVTLSSKNKMSEINRQLEKSKRVLEQITETKVIAFAYPDCAYNNGIMKAVQQAGYLAAVTCEMANLPGPDTLYRLSRIGVSDTYAPKQLYQKMESLRSYWETHSK